MALSYSNITSVFLDFTLPPEEINRLPEHADVRAIFTVPKIFNLLNKKLIDNIPVLDLGENFYEYKLFENSVTQVKQEATIDPQYDVMTILYSSGTTGTAKGIMLTYFSVLESIKICGKANNLRYDIANEHDYLLVAPFHHISGYQSGLTYLFAGSNLGIIENFQPSKLHTGLVQHNPYSFLMVPRALDVIKNKIEHQVTIKGWLVKIIFYCLIYISRFLRKYVGLNLGLTIFKKVNHSVFGTRIHNLGTGGSLCSRDTTRFFLDLGFGWANFYALTETNVPVVCTWVTDKYPIDGVGKVDRNEGIEIKINNTDEHGVGEIYVKTKLVMKGYFRDPKLTEEAFDNGYFKTGDLGYIDTKNNLHKRGYINAYWQKNSTF